MNNILLNTNLCPLVVPDTYGTFNYEMFSDRMENDEFTKEVYDNDNVIEAMRNATKKAWNDYNVSDALEKIGIKFIDVDDFHSPREYNFATDSFCLNFELSDDFHKKSTAMIEELIGDTNVQKYIERNYRSYSGYVNLSPENLDELKDSLDEERGVAELIMLTLVHEKVCIDAIADNFMYEVFENADPISDEYFVSEDLIDLYNNETLMSDVYHYFRFERIDYILDRFDNLSRKYDNDPLGHHVPVNWHSDLILWAHEKHLSAEDLISMMNNAA